MNAESQSPKAQRRSQRKQQKEIKQDKRNPKPIKARSRNQSIYIKSLLSNDLTFGIGPAGVGKTYVPARVYGQALMQGTIDKIYVSRPNVAKNKHRMGFLPGSAEEKAAPWLVPIFEGIKDSMSPAEFARMRKEKRIEEVPYEFMQGRTLADAAWIVDEAENLDLDDLYITLTRQGENLNTALCGDPNQSRIPDSGLMDVVSMAEENNMIGVGCVKFEPSDVVRSPQARQWVEAFNRKNLSNVPFCDKDEGNYLDNLPEFIRGKNGCRTGS